MSPTMHRASQADGKTKMSACGEISITLTKGALSLNLQAVVVKDLDCDILGGVPFMRDNGIVLDMPNNVILIKGRPFPYSTNVTSASPKSLVVRRTQSFVLRSEQKHVIYPGEFVQLKSPAGLEDDISIAMIQDIGSEWMGPTVTKSIGGTIRLHNPSSAPVAIAKHDHIASIHYTLEDPIKSACDIPTHTSPKIARVSCTKSQPFSSTVTTDPDNQMTSMERSSFDRLHKKYDNVFNPRIGAYNDASGHIRAFINMGPVEPPPQKARLPSYSTDKLQLLQQKMDELEDLGVLARPEELDIAIEHASPSFLVKKQDGGHRLVTAFTNIGTYAKPIPTKPSSTDDVLRFLAGFNFIIKTDMTKQFFQLPMKKSSLKYLGTLTPYKGMRVYTRAAMGMPGSTEHLDELMSRVLGPMLQEGVVKKIADDLYIGGQTVSELLINWERVLLRFENNNLRLSPSKTVICPITTTILGWVWSAGSIRASAHKITPLATSPPPPTVKCLRSWIGAFKHLKVCVPGYSSLLSDLEAATAGKDTKVAIDWTDELLESFHKAQAALNDLECITIPRPSDSLIITNDGAVKSGGIGAVLYVLRNNKMLIGGFFSAKLKPHQRKWLPCEVEALAIGASVKHWSPYIIESKHPVQVLTDSKPCVQAHEKLSRGQFSSSARVSTFLSTLSRYSVILQYVPGSANLPADYHSRHPPDCLEPSCQICSFIAECETATVCKLTVASILEGRDTLPFTSPLSWKASQHDCPAIRRTYAHLLQGTRPSKKDTNIRDVKRYLQVCTIGKGGLLVCRQTTPFYYSSDLTVIPRHVLGGLLTALHLRLQHPSKSQLLQVFRRSFFALDAESAINEVTTSCSQCSAIATIPKEIEEFSTSESIPRLGESFACDIIRRARQYIFIMRDTFSSYTIARLIPNEQRETLKSAVIESLEEIKSPNGCSVRIDGAQALQSLCTDAYLLSRGISLDLGRLKNRNKNPVAEKGVQELITEIKKAHPEGNPITPSQLAVVTATMNMRIRNRGLSAREIVHQRDPTTGLQLHMSDELLGSLQQQKRQANHLPSALSQAGSLLKATPANVSPGSLVFLKMDGDKHCARNMYIVSKVEPGFLYARKLMGSQLRNKPYKLKFTEVYHVPNGPTSAQHGDRASERYNSSDDEYDYTQPQPPEVPDQRLIVEAESGRPRRQCRPPGYLSDYVLDLDTIDNADGE